MIWKMPKEFDSKFRFVIVAAERAKHLQNGAPAKVQVRSRKPAFVAIEETAKGLVEFEILEETEEQ